MYNKLGQKINDLVKKEREVFNLINLLFMCNTLLKKKRGRIAEVKRRTQGNAKGEHKELSF